MHKDNAFPLNPLMMPKVHRHLEFYLVHFTQLNALTVMRVTVF